MSRFIDKAGKLKKSDISVNYLELSKTGPKHATKIFAALHMKVKSALLFI